MTIYTDGACIGNPGPGGWAWASVPKDRDRTGSGSPGVPTTNNRMEITAVLEALRAHPEGDLVICSDSKYVVDCVKQKWYRKWQANGWLNANRKPVLNRDLWEALIAALEGRNVRMVWVRGHAGDVMNEFVDHLARRAATG